MQNIIILDIPEAALEAFQREAMSVGVPLQGSLFWRPSATLPTSGNTGIGLAMAAAVKEYPLILVMPESMSIEREQGIKGSIARAEQIVAETPNAWMPQQFENPANVEIHRRTTAQEILRDFPDGLDVLMTGVGTGATLAAGAKKLPDLPDASRILTFSYDTGERYLSVDGLF